MGDVAMTVPVLRVFSKTYPEVKITVVSRKFFKPFFEDIPNCEFLTADVYGKHKHLGLLKLAKEAQEKEIDTVADLHNVIRSKIITRYFHFKKIKTATIDKGRADKKALTRAENKEFYPLKTTHQRYADVFAELGFPIDLSQNTYPSRKRLPPRINALIGVEPKKIIGIAPFAAFKSKMYPLELMKEVINSLDALDRYRIFLFGGGKEEIATLKNLEKKYSNVISIAGMFPFQDELALISNLDIMVSMDSGNGHLAAMMGIPVLTLWGVTHPFAGFAPFNQQEENQLLANRKEFPLIPTSVYGNKYPKDYENAMKTISPETVVKKIKEIL